MKKFFFMSCILSAASLAGMQQEKDLIRSLHFSAQSDDHFLDTCELINNGADVNAKDKFSNTPLMVATQALQLKTVEFLLSQEGIDVNHANSSLDGGSALHLLCMPKNRLLLYENSKYEADQAQHIKQQVIDQCNKDLCKQRETILEKLLQNGAAVNIKNRWGYTPLYYLLNRYPTIITDKLAVAQRTEIIDKEIRIEKLIPHVTNLIATIIKAGAHEKLVEGLAPTGKSAIEWAYSKKIPYFTQLADFAIKTADSIKLQQ